MSAYGSAWRLPGGYDPVVQARFCPDGKIYHYISNAMIGDTIMAPTNNLATVVGHGWGAGVTPYRIREAHVVRHTTKNTVERTITMNTDYAGSNPHGTVSNVAKIEQQLKAAKKDAKKARKAERERKAAAADKARLYSAGTGALEAMAGEDGPDRLAAALSLIAESRR